MDWKTLFLTADGRIGKRDFWIGFAILFGVGFIAGWIPLIGMIVSLALIYPWVCLQAKRLHDMGKTGWLMLAPMAVAIICSIVGMGIAGMAMMGAGMAGNEAAAAGAAVAGFGGALLAFGIAGLIGLAFLLWVGLTNGEPGENRFGPPPVSLTGGVASPPSVA